MQARLFAYGESVGGPDESDERRAVIEPALHLGLGAASLAYPILRYVVAGDVPAKDLPLFVANKAVALYAALALAVWALRKARADARGAAEWRRAFYLAAVVHVVMTLMLMGPTYYGKLYEADGRLGWAAGLGLLAGLAALLVAWSGAVRRVIGRPRALAIIALFMMGHVAGLGLPGWLAPASWPASLPPITLLSALAGLAALAARRR